MSNYFLVNSDVLLRMRNKNNWKRHLKSGKYVFQLKKLFPAKQHDVRSQSAVTIPHWMLSIRIKTILFYWLLLTSRGSIFLAEPSIFGPFRWLTRNILCFALHLEGNAYLWCIMRLSHLAAKILELYNYNSVGYSPRVYEVHRGAFHATAWDADGYWIVDTLHTNNSRNNAWICGAVTILPFLYTISKSKNCEIFYTEFEFYMGCDSSSMNIHSSAFAYIWGPKK